MTSEIRDLLFKPARGFTHPYRSEESGHAEQDLRLRTFASTMGQITESVTLDIMSGKFNLPEAEYAEVEELYKSVREPLRLAVRDIPEKKPRATFTHKQLYPTYLKMMQDEDWMDKFKVLAVNTDRTFHTNFVDKINAFGNGQRLEELEPPEDFSEARYLIDAILMSWHFYFDKDTRHILSQFGNFVPDIDLGTTQVDGIFVDPLFGTSSVDSNGRNGNDLLHKLTRKPEFARFEETVPQVVDCSIFEMKSLFLARDVAAHPQRQTPRSWHVAQVIGSMHNILHNHDVGLAPKHIILLYLGSLQPNMVHVIKPDALYWQNLADRVEHAILYGLGENTSDDLKDSLGKFLDLTTLLSKEAELAESCNKEEKEARTIERDSKKIGRQKKLRSFKTENWGVPPKKAKLKPEKKKIEPENPQLF